ncbi:cache domain-containing sensor histidine kinase [Bacillus pinisoli]|uniref:cache domain-containing sensor histidine kinase n=1 Tax=Bacillus pinisoli TaxID=2901866 RepID=UPI001FF341A1|nr:sensor histidine kinase [Bacillus pinisoli]
MKKWILRLNLFQRLLLYFAIIMILPLIIVASIIYMQSAKLLEQQAEDFLKQSVTNLAFQSDRFIKDYELATLPLVSNPNVKYFLDLNNGNVEEHIRYQYYQAIWTMMENIVVQNPEIDRMYIIGDNGRHISLRNEGITSQRLEKYKSLKSITPESGKIIIQPSNQSGDISITIARKIRGMESFVPNGILAIEISASQLGEMWKEANLGNEGFFMIADETGKVIYHPDFNLIGKQLNEAGRLELSQHKQGSFFDHWNNESTFFHFSTSEYTNWKLIAAVPESQLFVPISGVRLTAFLSAFFVLLLAFGISINFIKQIVLPIRLVEKTMKSVEEGKWKKLPNLARNDEISSLLISYNSMVDRLSTLVDQVYKAELDHKQVKIELQERELEKQKVEIQALQSQINPHFLYNTLETMGAYGMINGIDEISEMADSLATMFRYSVRNLELVTIGDEIEHIKNYLVIHEYRNKKSINLDLEIEPTFYEVPMVKLSLQPLVENAIEHGMKRSMKELSIKIRTRISGSSLKVCVIDNGKGMTNERVHEIMEHLKQNRMKESKLGSHLGIGIANVNRRIQLLFGDEYGVTISSQEDIGTTVTITIPFQKNHIESTKPSS